MRRFFALTRAGLLTTTSYRIGVVLSLFALLFQAVPTLYVAGALQPFMNAPGRLPGTQYYGWLITGTIGFLFLAAAMDSLPRAIESGLSTGTLEALLGTPTSVPTILAGISAGEIVWTGAKAAVFFTGAVVLGAHVAWARIPEAFVVILLIVASHYPIGVLVGAFLVAFRRAGPLQNLVALLSGLLGGIYYPTTMIPSWVKNVSLVLPITPGLRALRGILLDGKSLATMWVDVGTLVLFCAVGFSVSAAAFSLALRHARRNGSLAQY
jgi:ABC-2 type transport system permease protein